MHIYSLRWIGYVAAWFLAAAITGCAGPAALVTPVPSQTATQESTQTSPPPTRTPPAVASVTNTAAAEPTAGQLLISGPEVAFQSLTFHLPAEVASGVYAREAPAEERLGELYPASLELTLVEYSSRNTSFEPQIEVYPVSELAEAATQTAQELKDLLAARPATLPAGVPVLPTLPAGQLIQARIRYLTFNNGRGIGLLTQFAQDAWPINNEGLVYVFQGLTSDDSYYVSLFLPVSASFLPDHVDDPAAIPALDGIHFPDFSSTDFDSRYTLYRQAITQKLNDASAEEFAPALSLLDGLIESLQVGPVTAAPEAGNSPCINALPTRLHVDGYAYVNPDPPLPNNVRRDAGKDQPLLGDIRPGQPVKILEGPKCADGWVWWKVRDLETEVEGWTAEGDRQNYRLVPCPSRNQCGV